MVVAKLKTQRKEAGWTWPTCLNSLPNQAFLATLLLYEVAKFFARVRYVVKVCLYGEYGATHVTALL